MHETTISTFYTSFFLVIYSYAWYIEFFLTV